MLKVNHSIADKECFFDFVCATYRYSWYLQQERMLRFLSVSVQDSAGGQETRSSVHQSLPLLHLLHQPRVRLQRRHLPVRLPGRLHPHGETSEHVQRLSGLYPNDQWQLSSDCTTKNTPDDANFSLNFLMFCILKVKIVPVFLSSVVSWCRLQISVFYIQIMCRENFSQLSSKKYHHHCRVFKVQI